MRRGTTPDFILTVEGRDLTDKTVFVTLAQDRKKITKTNDEIEIETVIVDRGQASERTDSVISFSLTQEETLGFKEGDTEVQVRFIDSDDYAEATEIVSVEIGAVLLEKVIEYDGDSA